MSFHLAVGVPEHSAFDANVMTEAYLTIACSLRVPWTNRHFWQPCQSAKKEEGGEHMHSACAKYANGVVPLGAQLLSMVSIEMHGGTVSPDLYVPFGEHTLSSDACAPSSNKADVRRSDCIIFSKIK
jgi:hypothetical protein